MDYISEDFLIKWFPDVIQRLEEREDECVKGEKDKQLILEKGESLLFAIFFGQMHLKLENYEPKARSRKICP